MSDDGRADDGAREGAFTRPCERCGGRGEGVTLIWLWRARKFVCPICAVHESYEDALKAIEATAARMSAFDPFAARDVTQLAKQIRTQWSEQLEGKDPTRLPSFYTRSR